MEVQNSEIQLMRTLAEYSSDAIFIADVETARFLDANHTASEKTGYTKDEIIQLQVMDLDVKVNSMEQWRGLLQAARQQTAVGVDSFLRCKDGREIPMEVNVRLVNKNGREYIIGLVRDTTERKHFEEKMQKAQTDIAHMMRLMTINEIASEIAHELNQPLAAIVGFARGCHQYLRKTEENIKRFGDYIDEVIAKDDYPGLKSYLQNSATNVKAMMEITDEIEAQANRSAKVIQRVREFSKKAELSIEVLEINKSIETAVELMKPLARRLKIDFKLDLPEEGICIVADRVHIEQILVNILKNALEAMADFPVEKQEIFVQARLASDAGVEVIVRDYGRGFNAADAESLFTNYYTTKNDGLGVGLSISRKLIEASGGKLFLTGELNKGACAQLLLKSAQENVDCSHCYLEQACDLH